MVEKLYDERNPAQKAEVLKSFGDRQSVTREEVYEFVKRQIDLRAIEELDPNITKADIAALDTVEAQKRFHSAKCCNITRRIPSHGLGSLQPV